MREQRRLAVAIERRSARPRDRSSSRQLLRPLRWRASIAFAEALSVKPRRLGGEARALRRNLQAGVRRRSDRRRRGRARAARRRTRAGIVRQRVPQRERAMRRQLGEQTIRQRLMPSSSSARLGRPERRTAADGDRRSAGPTGWARGDRASSSALRSARRGRLVLGPDVAALDAQAAIGVDADEHAGAGDLGRIVDDGPLVERRERGLDLAEPLVDLVGQFVGVGILLLRAGRIRPSGRRSARCSSSVRSTVSPVRRRRPSVWPYGKSRRDRDPLPALGAQGPRLRPGASPSTSRSSSAGSWSQPPSSCWNRSRITTPPAAS